MRHRRLEKLVPYYKKPVDDLLKGWYLYEKYSVQQIVEKIEKETGIHVTTRGIQYVLGKLKIGRNLSDARKLAIFTRRVTYEPLRKPIKSVELRKGISLKNLYEVMKRDNFRCVLCGQNAKETKLLIDHIIPTTRGGNNDTSNLRTTCGACNHGKMIYEHEK